MFVYIYIYIPSKSVPTSLTRMKGGKDSLPSHLPVFHALSQQGGVCIRNYFRMDRSAKFTLLAGLSFTITSNSSSR